MGYKRNKHYNAVYTQVKFKGITLQKDIADMMNGSIDTAVKQLTEDGKVKRVKIKNRMRNGNLNNSWCLYLPTINYNDVLDFERKMINKPFESPLKEHHCYKLSVDDIEVYSAPADNENIIDMQEYVKVNNYEMMVKEYNDQRVVTTKDIAKAHKKTVKAVNQQLERNKHRLIENEDYFVVSREKAKVTDCDLEKYFNSNAQKEIYLFTETGYMMLVKTFSDNLSWEVQRQLVNTYFKMKDLSKKNEVQPIPSGQIQSLDIMEMMIKEMKNDRERVDKIEDKLNQIVNILSN